ncbi:shikimate kinase [Alloacidobacterium dinghuense]|uniref:Shikimate kinase n=1 Tax=Alloacidobacterium dinghuense TaxID=2763107 RepID=A0A7G8BM46_9BACT|nr:shikimate kinase [Alloacidobacterium dinghuense]QNI33616.1 shikimate kinase [Alloacidobacterium dinghuense]
MKTNPQLPACISRIVLVGFMGAGKSTVGALLAQQLRWRFLDTDTVLETRVRATIAEIFAQQGEASFRQLESEVIRDLLSEHHLVLALGGGAVETAATREALLNSPETCIVFLEATLEIMISRCEQQPGAALRPVLNDRERLRSRFEDRLPHYRNAHLVIQTAQLTPDETSQQILAAVSAFLKENTLA